MSRTGLRRSEQSNGYSIVPGEDVFGRVCVEAGVLLGRHVAEMGQQEGVGCLAQRMLGGKRLDVEHIQGRARDSALLERGEQRRLLDDRAA